MHKTTISSVRSLAILDQGCLDCFKSRDGQETLEQSCVHAGQNSLAIAQAAIVVHQPGLYAVEGLESETCFHSRACDKRAATDM